METHLPDDPRAVFIGLVGQFLLCAASAGVLFAVVPRLEVAGPDALFVWLLAIVLHALASLRFVDQATAFLHLDCPKCTQSFHGFPEQLPRPSRRHCASCGAELA